MVSIEVVSHCYSMELPHYADCLCYQLSSFITDINNTDYDYEVTATICCVKEDFATRRVLSWFDLRTMTIDKIRLNVIYLEREEIGRRSIGRNIAAKRSKADIVWFADVDQMFREDCLGKLSVLEWPDNAVMIYPKVIKIHKDHKTGDEVTKKVGTDPRLMDIDPTLFYDKKYRKAIGGVQIVRGDFAREHGYLDGYRRWQKSTKTPFKDFKDDMGYRRVCGKYGKTVGVDLPGMYRIRHLITTHV